MSFVRSVLNRFRSASYDRLLELLNAKTIHLLGRYNRDQAANAMPDSSGPAAIPDFRRLHVGSNLAEIRAAGLRRATGDFDGELAGSALTTGRIQSRSKRSNGSNRARPFRRLLRDCRGDRPL